MVLSSKITTSEKPLIILWSTPRSTSTAFEKAMMQHPYIVAIHEPFTDCYYFGNERCSTRYGNCSDKTAFDRYSAYAEIDRPGGHKVRFVKDLAFQAQPYVSDEFLRSATHLFLINDPDVVYASLVDLKPDFTEDEFGYTALYALYEQVCRTTGHRPRLYTTEMFRNNPEAVLRQVCNLSWLDFVPTMLHWNPGPIRHWQPHETQSQSKWHSTMEQSDRIIPYQKPATPTQAPPDRFRMIETAWGIFTRLTEPESEKLHRQDIQAMGSRA